jgi:uncharacterized membrane protein
VFLRFAFRERPYDLVVVLILGAILALFALLGVTGLARIAVGLVFIFSAPGYVLVAVLFPRSSDLDWIERLALSVSLSIALVALIGLGLNFTPWGIRLEPVLASILLFTNGVGAVAYWWRMKLSPEERLSLSIEIRAPDWSSYSRSDKLAAIVLAASISFATGAVVYVVVTPRYAEHFTELYILNATGVAGSYPRNLTVNQTATIKLTVHNVEYDEIAYEIRVHRATMEAFFNATANRTQYRELSRAYITNFSQDLQNGGYWNRSYSFSIPIPGIYRLYFDLYKLPDDHTIYRQVFLTVWVRSS